MLNILQKIASLKVTLAGMVLLAIGSIWIYGNSVDVSQWVLVVPLALLAINLACAIITNPRINGPPGLLIFHLALLSIAILAAIGRLVHLDAHVEMPLGAEFGPEQLLETQAGPLHGGAIEKVSFVQGPYSVEYAAYRRRGLTFSHVKVHDSKGQWIAQVVGDDRPLVIQSYRFYTTHNKGFSPILTWIPDNGEAITGFVNMPSYPLFDYKQDNGWTPPGGKEIKFWLQLNTGLKEEAPWTLDSKKATAILAVTSNGQRVELPPGSEVRLDGGKLRFEALSSWMGYRVFYDPTIKWLFFVSIAGVLGLAQFFWTKINLQPWMEEKNDTDNQIESDVYPSDNSQEPNLLTRQALSHPTEPMVDKSS
jgi:cytochrome c biogenesis protein ResB